MNEINQPLSIADRVAKQQAEAASLATESQQSYNSAQNQFFQNQEDYVSGRRNPIADLIKKPERDAAKEKRLKQVAQWSFIKDAVGLIGKGYAASKGVMPSKTEGAGTYKALEELNRLDDTYRQEGYRYDQNALMDAMRRQGAADDLQKIKLGLAQNEANYKRSKADRLDETMLNIGLSNERLAAAKADKLEDREWQEAQADKGHKRQVDLINMQSSSRSDKEFRISPGNVALVVKNKLTGKMEPIADGDYAAYLNDAIKDDPSINDAMAKADNAFKSKQIADMAVSSYLSKRGVQVEQINIATDIAKDMKNNGYTSTSITNLRLSPVGSALQHMSDEDVITEFKKQGVEVVKVQ